MKKNSHKTTSRTSACLPVVLAIDTSCDDTSAAVTCGFEVWSNVVASQTDLHRQYGGVFPTEAKLAHKQNIAPTVQAALKRAHLSLADVDLIAVTQGPGLAPALEVGISYAKNLASEWQKPLIGINHLEAHLLSVWAKPATKSKLSTQTLSQRRQIATNHTKEIEKQMQFPALGMIISGGNSMFVLIDQPGEKSNKFSDRSLSPNSNSTPAQLDRQPRLNLETHNSGRFAYQIIGQTLDDAAGEALDKIGRMINLGYPAGPVIEQLAKYGNPQSFEWPLPMTHTTDFNLSFSGLKTFARNLTEEKWAKKPPTQQEIYNFTASLQYAIFRHISYKLSKILTHFTKNQKPIKSLWLGGGVAANTTLRKTLRQTLKQQKLKLQTTYTKKLCIDNAAMVGVCAETIIRENLIRNQQNSDLKSAQPLTTHLLLLPD